MHLRGVEIDWPALHKIIGDTTRRNILELLARKGVLSYTDIMSLLNITNTGRLNYHLKILGELIEKDVEGRYRLTEKGRLAAELLQTFPERIANEKKHSLAKMVVAAILIILDILILSAAVSLVIGSPTAIVTSTSTTQEVSDIVLHPNVTQFVGGTQSINGTLELSWAATGPITVYVLNGTQYADLLLNGSLTNTQSQNFTGPPPSWSYRFQSVNGNISLSIHLTPYYIYTSSPVDTVITDFKITSFMQPIQSPTQPTSLILYIPLLALLAFALLLISLGILILKEKIWM